MKRFLKQILGGATRRRLDDPVFGELSFFDFGDPERNYWEGETHTAEGSSSIGSAIHADSQGPSEAQREFFLHLVSDQDALFRRCAAILVPEWESWCSATFPFNWRSELALTHVYVPANGDRTRFWEVTFEARSDVNHLFSVQFENDEPLRVTIDG